MAHGETACASTASRKRLITSGATESAAGCDKPPAGGCLWLTGKTDRRFRMRQVPEVCCQCGGAGGKGKVPAGRGWVSPK